MDYNPKTKDYLVDYDLFDKTEEVKNGTSKKCGFFKKKKTKKV